jgi:hypothetical protein
MICLKSQADLVSHGGDWLCERCRAVFWVAVVLLERHITDEDIVIPTLAFARNAAGSAMYKDLAKMDGPVEGCIPHDLAEIAFDGTGLSLLSAEQAYMGLELVEVVDGVPLVRVHPYAVFAEKHFGSHLPKRVCFQILSRRVKPASIRNRYERFLEEQGADWGKNLSGCISYNFSRSYLEIRIEGLGESYTWGLEDSEDPLHWPVYHFPQPMIVEGFCDGLLRSLRSGEWKSEDVYGLDLYGKPLDKTAEKVIPAFVAWHVGVGVGGRIYAPDRNRVSRVLNKHLLRPCDKGELPEDQWSPSDTLWRDVEALRLRFARLHRAGSTRPLPPLTP